MGGMGVKNVYTRRKKARYFNVVRLFPLHEQRLR